MTALDARLFLVSEDERAMIKTRTKQLIKLAGGPELFQHSAGVQTPALSGYGSPSDPAFIRADVIVALDRQNEAPLMLEFLANMVGYTLVPKEPVPPAAVDASDLAEVAKETSDVVTSLAAIVGGRHDPAAARRGALKEIDEGISSLYRARRKVAS